MYDVLIWLSGGKNEENDEFYKKILLKKEKVDLQEKKEIIDKIFDSNFCEHLLNFLIKKEMTTSDFEKRGEDFFRKIKEWKETYFLEEKKIMLNGIEGWYFCLTITEFRLDFSSAAEEEMEDNIWMMFLVNRFHNLDPHDYNHYRRNYDEAFFQKYYPEFQKLFLGKEDKISDFEKNICDEFQFEFSQGCVIQLTKELWIQELENYEKVSLERFSYYCNSKNHGINYEVVAELKEEYPRYHAMLSMLKNDLEVLQVF